MVNPKKPIFDEIVTLKNDVDIFHGWLNSYNGGILENPDPTLLTQSNGKGLSLYDDVKRDLRIGGALQSRYDAVVCRPWEIVPAKEKTAKGLVVTDRNQLIADTVKDVLQTTNFDPARKEHLQAILYGAYFMEPMWQEKKGIVALEKLKCEHPRRFSITTERETRLLTPDNMIEGEEIPDKKMIRFTFGSTSNPWGEGLGSYLWWAQWFKKSDIKYWLVRLDRFGNPTPMGHYPGGDKDAKKRMLEVLDSIKNDSGLAIPDGMTVELLEAMRGGKESYLDFLEYMDKSCLLRIKSQTASTEGTPGKLGKEESQDETEQNVVQSDAKLLDDCYNETLIKWIVDYNFFGVEDYPLIKTNTEPKKDMIKLVTVDSALVNEVGLDMGQQALYEKYGVPKPEEGEDLVKGKAQGSGENPGHLLQRPKEFSDPPKKKA